MKISDFKIGDLITNGNSAGRVTEMVAKDPSWKVAGVRIANIGLEAFGGNTGMTSFVPDYLLGGWRLIPLDWSPVVGGGLEERYTWAAGYSRLRREVRRCEQTSGASRG